MFKFLRQIGLRKISLFFGGLFVLLILVLGSLQIAGIISFSKGKNPEVRSAQTSVTRPKGSPIMTPSLTPTPVLTPVPTPRPIIKPTPTPVVLPPTVTFGYSAKGRPITGYIFGSGGEGILIFGAIHGNERGTVSLINTLVETIARHSSLVGPTKKVVLIPVANPDGYWERNDKLNANGINININFETSGWKNYGGENNDYAGPFPFSESESRTIKDVVLQYNIKKMVSFHARGNLVNPEIHGPSEELARWYVARTGYSLYEDPSWSYPGTATKWFTEAVGGPAITVELSDYYASDWYINKGALLELIQ